MIHRMPIPKLRAGALVLACLAIGQPELQAQATELRWIAGRPVVRVLVRGAVDYPCHLLVDLGLAAPLLLHNNAAGAVKTPSVDVVAGDLTLANLAVTAERDTWLEDFTRDHDEALDQVPLAGRLGRGAFRGQRLVIDGPAGTLALEAVSRPDPGPGLAVVDLLADPVRQGISFLVTIDGVPRRARLRTEEAASIASPAIRPQWVGGRMDGVWLGTADVTGSQEATGVDLGAVVPFRRAPTPSSDLEFGGPLLERTRSILAMDQGWLSIERAAEATYPFGEAEFYAALGAADEEAALTEFLSNHPLSRFAPTAARRLLQLAGSDPSAAGEAAIELLHNVDELKRGREALRLLNEWPQTPEWDQARRNLATAALPLAGEDEDGTAVLQLRRVLGEMDLREGDLDQARRHLLSAVFGMPDDGSTQLAMARLHRARQEWERARARYFLAMLDPEASGEAGYLGVLAMHDKLGDEVAVEQRLLEWAEGRVDALHPPRRPADEEEPSGRTVLVELFTGAHCDPCIAADMAFGAAAEWFRADEVAFVQWHLPSPAPEPLVSRAAFDRARDLGVRGTPTVRVDGRDLTLGGAADDASDRFAALRDAVTERLKLAPTAILDGSAERRGRTITATAMATATGDDGAAISGLRLHAVLVEGLMAYPGNNGQMFHHQVVRSALTPASGVAFDGKWQGTADLDAVTIELDQTLDSIESQGRFGIRPIQPDVDDLAVVVWITRDGRPEQALHLEVHAP